MLLSLRRSRTARFWCIALVLVALPVGMGARWYHSRLLQARMARLKQAGAIVTATPVFPSWVNSGLAMFDTESSRLADINLNHADVDDEILAVGADVGYLSSLDLSFSDTVSDVGMKHLERVSTLKFLNVSGTPVTADAIRSFQNAQPQCQVVQDSIANGGLVAEQLEVGQLPSGTDWSDWIVVLHNPTPREVRIDRFNYG